MEADLISAGFGARVRCRTNLQLADDADATAISARNREFLIF